MTLALAACMRRRGSGAAFRQFTQMSSSSFLLFVIVCMNGSRDRFSCMKRIILSDDRKHSRSLYISIGRADTPTSLGRRHVSDETLPCPRITTQDQPLLPTHACFLGRSHPNNPPFSDPASSISCSTHKPFPFPSSHVSN